jgi:hypothetical protein
MSHDGPTSLLTRALRETLDVFVAPPVRNALLQDALRAGGLSEIPTTAGAVKQFVQGPLRDMTSRALGPELADSIADEMSRVLERAEDKPKSGRENLPRLPRHNTPSISPSSPPPPQTRRSFSPSPEMRRNFTPRPPSIGQSYIRRQAGGTTANPPPLSTSAYFRSVASAALADTEQSAGTEPALVLVASSDDRLVRALSTWLDGRARVELVRSVFTLIQTVGDLGPKRLILVLDAAQPGVRPAAVAALADDLTDVRLVLVRSTKALEQRLLRISPATRTWTIFRDATEIDEIASNCAALVG